jgi:DNA modification methylase
LPKQTILVGDVRDKLREMPAQSVHSCVTSPPYYGLRDYKIPPSTWGDGWVGCLGNEPTVEMYLTHLVEVFFEVRRVLRDDGTLWLNLGDSYASGSTSGPQGKNGQRADRAFTARGAGGVVPEGMKPKDLMMVPAMAAIALRSAGWYLRSDIIWHKPNPMPESIRDRPTSAHEHVFLLTKNPRYYYDADAIAEPSVADHGSGNGYKRPAQISRNGRGSDDPYTPKPSRNRRNVWTVSAAPYKGAHFATFPPKLIEPMILAGTSAKGACGSCGAPWVRQTETSYDNPGNRTTNGPRSLAQRHETAGFAVRLEKRVETLGWSPSCACPAADPVPCVVLDPFLGSGTTLMVADWNGRDGVGIELSAAYAEMARARICQKGELFTEVLIA